MDKDCDTFIRQGVEDHLHTRTRAHLRILDVAPRLLGLTLGGLHALHYRARYILFRASSYVKVRDAGKQQNTTQPAELCVY